MKHKDILDQMTLIEKAAIVGGQGEWQTWPIPRLNIPSMYCSDGPHGIRKQAGAGDHLGLNESLKATCFPTAATVANSWDVALGEKIGRALGEEAMAEDVHILLGPGMNMKRSPLCGRNFEYFSEDPHLAGKMAAAYVRGIQSKGVRSCIKHFAVNSQEERRMAMDAVVDERTLREIYLTAFEIAIKEGKAKALMTSYNEVNGEYANENAHLLLDILRGEWGYDGMVVTDWGGSNDHVKGIKCRSNLEMPNPGLDSARQVIAAIENGTLTKAELDLCVDDLLDAILETTQAAKGHSTEFDIEGHHALAREAAAQCAVLLKNEGKILPLAEGTKVAVIGDFAFKPRYQGAGSSMVNTTKLESFIEIAQESSALEIVASSAGYQRNGDPDEALKNEAVEAAKQADVVLYFFGLDEMSESEGLDRQHMKLPKVQLELLKALAGANPNIVGILSGGSSIEMDWDTDLKAVLHGYLTGQAGGGAVYDIITGAVNPSGKLAETYPVAYEDTPAFNYYPAKERTSEYREGLYIGYRYFDTAHVPVKYPFGYGLSYTKFEYTDLKVNAEGATFKIINTGKLDGAEIAQLYISLPGAEVFRPEKELKGFAKVFLKAGETKTVTIAFNDMTFRYWNVEDEAWAVEGGIYKILVGSSSADIRLAADLSVAGVGSGNPYDRKKVPAYYSGDITRVPDGQFETILGRPIPDGSWTRDLTENDAICQLKNSKSWICRRVYGVLERKKKKAEAAGKPDLNVLFIYNMPFRAIGKMTGGAVSQEMVEGMVKVVNGHFFGGIGTVIGGYFRNGRLNKAYEKSLKKQ
ncbi:MAG: glycoside hydrolase family 3 C-terminal domain-containing protein [Lachnospiraceae bacterium]|nr:glycoside hydrolase family 3 C-terminal domain-containing protein [Lachnospiraceae bacterium]